jgi:hypothetical protein
MEDGIAQRKRAGELSQLFAIQFDATLRPNRGAQIAPFVDSESI